MTQLLLHIGTGKTGTSSLQNFLFLNHAALRRRFGICYPKTGLSHAHHFGESIHAHYPAVTWISGRDAHNLSKLAKEISRSSCQLAVISCENLYHHLSWEDISFLSEFLGDFSMQIVCYVRRQDLYMESAWKQQVKVGQMKTPFEKFLKWHTEPEHLGKVHANYYRMLKVWADVFGIDAIKVRVFDQSEWVNADLIDDFLSVCGVDLKQAGQFLTKLAPKSNEALLPSELLQTVQKANAMKSIPRGRQEDFVNSLMQEGIFNDPPLLSLSDRLAILNNYNEPNRLLFKEFLKSTIPPCFSADSVLAFENQAHCSQKIDAKTDEKVNPSRTATKNFISFKNIGKKVRSQLASFLKQTAQQNQVKTLDRTIRTDRKPQASPFVTKVKMEPISFADYPNFSFYGFARMSKLTAPLTMSLPRQVITVDGCFVSKAALSHKDLTKTLTGGLYENGCLIRAATDRGGGRFPNNPEKIDQKRIYEARTIYGSCVYMGWLLSGFGHSLLEAPARFWFLDSIDIASHSFLFHSLHRTVTKQPLTTEIIGNKVLDFFLDSFGIKKTQVFFADSDLFIEKLVVPSSLFFLGQTMDSHQLNIYNRIKNYALNQKSLPNKTELFSPPKKIYLSRRLLKKALKNRKAVNENEIEDLFAHYGFSIVFPEQLHFEAQISLFNNAEIVAGCEGSALHTGLFSPPDTKMIVLSARGIIVDQLIINDLNKIQTHYINAGTNRKERVHGEWEADISFISETLNKILLTQ